MNGRNDTCASSNLGESPTIDAREHTGGRPRIWLLGLLSSFALVLIASCGGAPRYQATPGEDASREPSRQDIVRFAKTFVGTPYRSGGTSYKGVDCSGLAFVVYREFDIRLPRTSLDQSRAGVPVDRSDLKPADLVFFKTSRRGSVSHVGIYVGRGNFIHASTGERKVRIDTLSDDYYRTRYMGARRVLES